MSHPLISMACQGFGSPRIESGGPEDAKCRSFVEKLLDEITLGAAPGRPDGNPPAGYAQEIAVFDGELGRNFRGTALRVRLLFAILCRY